ncbi:MAG: HAD-IA family hydrolase [Anaerolineaceae bacterium]|jgi:putative hydrolase of the HAD superfamily|nr:HAD-IA family hydrolase [Anaerolineaceae bacterium]
MNSSITTLVFDDGTLIRDEARWPELHAMEGAHTALDALSGQYRLVLATNAPDSNSGKVQKANRRLKLDGFFERIYTAREMGFSKPDKAYFQAMAADLVADPSELLMIGDGYTNDILGACHAGWQAVWFNPHYQPCTSLTPLHSAEIDHLAALPQAIADLILPTVPQCLHWLRLQHASFNLIQHVQTVAASAYQMALWLRASGQVVNPILAHRGGLLHDLGKLKSLRGQSGGFSHGDYGAQLLNAWGFPQLAEIARRHMLFTIHDPALAPRTLEEMLVYFCDKIVEGTRIVPLTERIQKLSRRYARDEAQINACLPPLQTMQHSLCRAINIPDEDLIPRLAKSLLEK